MFDGNKPHHDVFTNYLSYTEATEPPVIYHRWCFLTALGAAIGRKTFIEHGHFRVFANLYVMLLGEPAARKSTSIKMIKKLLAAANYENFAADKTTKEKFLLDLEGITEDVELDNENRRGKRTSKYDATTAENLWGSSNEQDPREIFIVADEFNDFAGTGNTDFFTTLGNLWDFDNPSQPFTQRLKNSRSVSIYQPTISILSGNTPELFARAFPPEAIGSGFLSRLLLIHGEWSGRKITFPPPPDEILGEAISNFFRKVITLPGSKLEIVPGARNLLDNIYQSQPVVPDIRFKHYDNRRFTQLLKICLILTVTKFKCLVEEEDVIQANTILSYAEIFMPKAIGEFGKSRNSDIANKVMDVIERTSRPIGLKDIWEQIHKDCGGMRDLIELLNGLVAANKIQSVVGSGVNGFLPKKIPRVDPPYIDWSMLSREERDAI